jgi:hypothetical protein
MLSALATLHAREASVAIIARPAAILLLSPFVYTALKHRLADLSDDERYRAYRSKVTFRGDPRPVLTVQGAGARSSKASDRLAPSGHFSENIT